METPLPEATNLRANDIKEQDGVDLAFAAPPVDLPGHRNVPETKEFRYSYDDDQPVQIGSVLPKFDRAIPPTTPMSDRSLVPPTTPPNKPLSQL